VAEPAGPVGFVRLGDPSVQWDRSVGSVGSLKNKVKSRQKGANKKSQSDARRVPEGSWRAWAARGTPQKRAESKSRAPKVVQESSKSEAPRAAQKGPQRPPKKTPRSAKGHQEAPKRGPKVANYDFEKYF